MHKPIPRDPRTLGMLALVGITNTALPYLLITTGEQTINSGLASILNATVPLFTIVIAHLALADDRMYRGKILGLLTGFTGVVLLFAQGSVSSDIAFAQFARVGLAPGTFVGHSNPIFGQIAVLLAAVLYAGSAVLIRRYLRGVEPLVTAGSSAVVGAVALLVITAIVERPLPNLSGVQSQTVLAVVTLAIVNTFIANSLYYTLIANWGASRATMVTYLVPPIALVLGAIVNGEALNIFVAIGAALIIGGVALANLGRPKTVPPPSAAEVAVEVASTGSAVA